MESRPACPIYASIIFCFRIRLPYGFMNMECGWLIIIWFFSPVDPWNPPWIVDLLSYGMCSTIKSSPKNSGKILKINKLSMYLNSNLPIFGIIILIKGTHCCHVLSRVWIRHGTNLNIPKLQSPNNRSSVTELLVRFPKPSIELFKYRTPNILLHIERQINSKVCNTQNQNLELSEP